jgi:hypothetical protein
VKSLYHRTLLALRDALGEEDVAAVSEDASTASGGTAEEDSVAMDKSGGRS